MIPGYGMSKLSESAVTAAASIGPVTTDLIRVSGTTTIATIKPPAGPGGFSGLLFFVPLTENVATTTSGNVAVAVTIPFGRVTVLVYSKTTAKWYPGAIS